MRGLAPAVLVLWALASVALAPKAQAAGPIKSFSLELSATQAGAHPDVSMHFGMGSEPARTADRVTFDWPPGLVVLAPAVAVCELADFDLGQCSSDSQLGIVTIREAHEGAEVVLGTAPVFALKPVKEWDEGWESHFAGIGFVIPGLEEPVYGSLYRPETIANVSLTLFEFPRTSPLASLDLTLWGVPDASSHDAARFPTGTNGCAGLADTSCNSTPVSSNLPAQPQIENPTACPSGPQPATATLATYEGEGHLDTANMEMPSTTGCGLLSFNPSVQPKLTTTEARSPSGLDLKLQVPQEESPTVPAPSELHAAEVVFEGGVLLGGASEVMGVCKNNVYSEFPSPCPSSSVMGTATIAAKVLPSPLSGTLYFGGGFEELFEDEEEEVFIGAAGYVVYLVIPGYHLPVLFLEEENENGEVVTVIFIESLPQAPTSEILLHFSPASEALRTVNHCGEFDATTYFEAWDSVIPIQSGINVMSLDSGPGGAPCPGPARKVSVSLSPTSIPADGTGGTEATARVTDANGGPVSDDSVEFRSSDPGEQIEPATEVEDGVYRALITASSTPGSVTITAVDSTASITGSATLEQTGLQGPTAPISKAEPVPVAKISRHPRPRTQNRRPLFGFSSSVPGSTFRCGLDSKPYRLCTSPLKLKGLAPGKHRFRVFAVSPGGQQGEPATFRFVVLKRSAKRLVKRRRRGGAARQSARAQTAPPPRPRRRRLRSA